MTAAVVYTLIGCAIACFFLSFVFCYREEPDGRCLNRPIRACEGWRVFQVSLLLFAFTPVIGAVVYATEHLRVTWQ